VQRRTSSGGSFETIAADISATSFTDPSPASGVTNSYRIISHAGTYASQPSAEVGFVFSGLPTGWNQQDIGSVGLVGTSAFLGTTFTLQGSGADIWETTDGCHFLSQGISGDFVITARLASMSNTDYWAKAGLMIRESSSAVSKNVSLLVTPQVGGTRMQWRNSQGGSTFDHELSGSNAPLWLRITRSGNTLTGWQSNDGATWAISHAVSLAMNSNVLVGLAVTSHKNDALNTAIFDSVSLTTNKATATVTLGNLSASYNGSAKAATATTDPTGLTVNFTYDGSATAPTAVGSYAVVATINDASYQGSASGTLVITWSWNAFQNLWFAPGQIANADVSAPTADANQDGLKNFFAYSSGISPWIQATTENGGFPIVAIQSGFLTITYTRLKQRFDFDCVPEVSSDLATWNSGAGFTTQTEVTPLDDIRERVQVRDTIPSENTNQRYMRLSGVFLP
jgi:regulation of enolase protein 1 (concanavalin A-like superfamily)